MTHTPQHSLYCKDHQPKRESQRETKEDAERGCVKISTNWCLVSIQQMERLPFLTWEQKWWYFKAMRQVLGCIFGALASSTQPLLSSKMVEWATVEPTINFVVVPSSWRRPHIGMRSWADWERAMYSASVVLKAISVSLFEHHRTGQEAKVITCKVWQKKDPQK